MQSATNVKIGTKEERPLLCVYIPSLRKVTLLKSLGTHRTGVHTVADVFCLGCNERLGWYYHKAAEYAQKYKEGAHQYWRCGPGS
jgi:hypothetical protein